MNELLLIGKQQSSPVVFNIPPLEPVDSKSVLDISGIHQFSATGSSSVISHPFGDKVLGMQSAGGHFENLSNVDLRLLNSPFEVNLDMYLFGYPVQEGAVFSQLNPGTGGGVFGLTMASVTNPRRLAFFFTSDGNISSRKVVVADRDVPLLTPVKVMIRYTGTEVKIFMDEVQVGTINATTIHSIGHPIGIGGHYGTNSYNMNGMLKNITITKI